MTEGGLAFQHDIENKTFTIEVLSGTWNGTNCVLGMTERGGNLNFQSNNLAYVQLSHNALHGMRLTYEGISLSTLETEHSWNGTIPVDTEIYLKWSFSFLMPHEENFMVYVGASGIILFMVSLLLGAWGLKKYGLFSMEHTSIWEWDAVPFIVIGLIVGVGLIITWLMV